MFNINYVQVKETFQKYLKIISGKIKRTKCDVDCWNYGMFGGKGGCGALDSWGSVHEILEPGEPCLHPDKKEYADVSFIVSDLGLCTALEGVVIVGGKQDNTQLVKVLTECEVK